MSSRQPRDRASEPSPPHQPAYAQGFASPNAPTTLHQPTPSGWVSTSMSLPVSECKVVPTTTTANYYNISKLYREQGSHKRLHLVPIHWSSMINVISPSRYLSWLLKATQGNAPGMGCGPKSSKIIYFVRRTGHKQRVPAFRSIPSLHPMTPAAHHRVVTPVGLTYPWAALRQIDI
jgi:hypothetical protein